MNDTIPHLYSQLASVEIHFQPFPHHGLSRDHVVRHPRIIGGTPLPNCVISIHNRRGGAVFQNGTRNTLHADTGKSDQPPARKRIIGLFWSQNLTVDLRRIYLTPRYLTAWSQPYRDDKCTKHIFCLNFARQLQTNHEQTCTQNRPKHPRVGN